VYMNREILEKPFTPEQIQRRQGTNGDVLDYIEGCAVIQRLNECFEAEWIFEIQEHRIYDDEVVVLGKLTAQGVAKSQFGKSRITRAKKDNSIISLGDDLKAAATDCLKKCATLFWSRIAPVLRRAADRKWKRPRERTREWQQSGQWQWRAPIQWMEWSGRKWLRKRSSHSEATLGDLCRGQSEGMVEQAGARLLAGDVWKTSGLPQQEGSIGGHPAPSRRPK
jgi:hypothetical protein